MGRRFNTNFIKFTHFHIFVLLRFCSNSCLVSLAGGSTEQFHIGAFLLELVLGYIGSYRFNLSVKLELNHEKYKEKWKNRAEPNQTKPFYDA